MDGTQAFDPPGAGAAASLPASLEAFAYPAPVVLVSNTPGKNTVIAVEMYLYQRPPT